MEDPPLIAALGRGTAATTNTCQIEGGYWFEVGCGQQRMMVFLQLQNEVEHQYVQSAVFEVPAPLFKVDNTDITLQRNVVLTTFEI